MDSTILGLIVIIASTLGAAFAALLPYWKKMRELQAIGQPIKFDKVFVKTFAMAVLVGLIGSLMSFDANFAVVNTHDTIIKIFITGFIAAAGGNVVLNAFIKPSSLASEVTLLKTAHSALMEENINLRKITGTNNQQPQPGGVITAKTAVQ